MRHGGEIAVNTQKRLMNPAVVIVGGIVVILILVLGTALTGRSATHDTEEAVRTVSSLYLDELAGRREQVVASNLADNIEKVRVAVGLIEPTDLESEASLRAYQSRIKQLYGLNKFAFVDTEGAIYTADEGRVEGRVADYHFDVETMTEPVVHAHNLERPEKQVVITVPIDPLQFEGHELTACFIERDMRTMLEGASIMSTGTGTTFCNIYTHDGVALSNTVLGGLAVEDNLLEAMQHAAFEPGFSLEKMLSDFEEGNAGVVSFSYNGIRETLSYVPVDGTDWMLTYLIRESVIGDQISSVTNSIIVRSVVQSALTALVLFAVFAFIVMQMRRNARLALEKEASEAESRVKQEEMEQRLALQTQLLEQEKQRTQQGNMIQALAADYRSVYYLELDKNEGICYQAHEDLEHGLSEGEHFAYREMFAAYAEENVTDAYRDEFLQFVQPENVLEALKHDDVISYRYTVNRHGREEYEMIRFAGVRSAEDGEGGSGGSEVYAVGACLTDVDAETRKTLAQSQALSDALKEAEQANKAKTAFLSNMSHEIRTPMNAIIGLDNIALNNPDLPEETREHLQKIGSSAQHLLSLINDILDMSRIESGRMTLKSEEFSFSKLLEQINTIVSGQCNDKGLDYTCTTDGHVDGYYIGDNMKLRQVLINILGNAVKFTPEGGKVRLSVERTAHFDGKSTLRFVISDTGIGMSQDYLPRIFDTFSQENSSTTSRYGSSGLGLAITKSIVEMMNGRIEVESEKGVGSTFTVTVTLRDAERDDEQPDDEELRPGDLNVLVVDDDPLACEHAKIVLEKVGIACDTATSGAEAIEMIKLRHARRAAYKLVVIDWQMPEMDGVETTRHIRSIIGDEAAVVILTAYRWDDVYDEAVEAGVDSFLSKPLFAASVLEEFRDALRKRNLLGTHVQNKADLNGRLVLLAEDVEVNAEIIAMLLELRGMSVDHAANGRIAVEKFAEHEEGHYDAVLMDMRMPEMDGLEATMKIRAMDRADAKAIPIIALTANAFDEDVQRSLQAGLNAHLSKPVEPDNLYETLESLIPE